MHSMSPIRRDAWLSRIRKLWATRSIVWLSGVRSVGKTTLAGMLPEARFFNCDLPSVRRSLADAELFLEGQRADATLIFDEVHQLDDPSLLLKILADEHPTVRALATGSSTLAATRKFRDSLTGRKHSLRLPPVLWEECPAWLGSADLDRRLLHGGMPVALLSDSPPHALYSEWADSYYARDIEELFRLRSRRGFQSLLGILLRQSGGQIQINRLASDCGLSRPTVRTHLEAMQVTHAVHLLKPFHGGGKREIVARPKCYGFDTGFVCFEKGWAQIRPDDRGILWEHLVLDSLRCLVDDARLFYWRDKSNRELDFIVRGNRGRVDAIECKINPDHARPQAIGAFRGAYPDGRNCIVSPSVRQPYAIRRRGRVFTVCDTKHLRSLLAGG